MDNSDIQTTSKSHKGLLIAIGALLIVAIIAVVAVMSYSSPAKRAARKLELADRYMTELKYDEAIVLYKEVLEIEPKTVRAYEGLIGAYVATDNVAEAKAVIAQAETVLPAQAVSELNELLQEKIDSMPMSGANADKENSTGEDSELSESEEKPAREETFYYLDGSYFVTKYVKDDIIEKITHYRADGTEYLYVLYENDSQGRVIKKTIFYSDYGEAFSYEFKYDESGKRIGKSEITIEDGTKYVYYTSYKYNEAGVCIEEKWSSVEGDTLTEYDADGKPLKVTNSGGTGYIYTWDEYEYDSHGRLTKKTTHEHDDSISSWTEYSFSEDGRTATVWHCTPLAGGRTIWFNIEEYSDGGVLLKSTNYTDGQNAGYFFEYDFDGDRLYVGD